jgi:hypothetical protein
MKIIMGYLHLNFWLVYLIFHKKIKLTSGSSPFVAICLFLLFPPLFALFNKLGNMKLHKLAGGAKEAEEWPEEKEVSEENAIENGCKGLI